MAASLEVGTIVQGYTETPFYLRTKFAYTILAVAMFAAVLFSGVVQFSKEEILNFIYAVFGGTLGAHTLTDVVSRVTSIFTRPRLAEAPISTTPLPTEEEDGTEEELEDDEEELEDDEKGDSTP